MRTHPASEAIMTPNALLTIDDVAARLSATRARAYELVRRGTLPGVRIGRQVRVHPQALEEWLRAGGKALPGGWRRENPDA